MRRRTFLLAPAAGSLAGAPVAMSNRVAFELWDVFSSERFLGNPLAVFVDASGLADAQMGAIAREMGQSETTFVIPRPSQTERRGGIRVRIFSRAGAEMPFAGHPVLGTAFALWTRDRRRTDADGLAIRLSLPVGEVPVAFRQKADGGWEGDMTQPNPIFAETHKPETLAPLLGLRVEDIDASLPLQTVSTGRPNVIVMCKERDAVKRAAFDWRGLDAYFATGDKERGIYLLTRDVESKAAQFHARKVTRAGDDPVTGSAGGCAIAWLVAHRVTESGKRIVIEQGSEVHRRGEMLTMAEIVDGRVTNVRVGGQAVRALRGTLD